MGRRWPECVAALACVAIVAPLAVAQTDPSSPVLHRGGRTAVVVQVSASGSGDGARAGLAALVAACRDRLALSTADSAAIVGASVPAADVGADAPATVTLSLMPVHVLESPCRPEVGLALRAAAHGVRLTRDSAAVAGGGVLDAQVFRRDEELAPIAVQRLPLYRLGAAGLVPTGETWLRLTLPLASLEYAAVGPDPGLEIAVQYGAGGAPDEFRLPAESLRRMWRSLLPARAAALRSGAPSLMDLPSPSDSVLRAAHAAYRAGDVATAAGLATQRMLAAAPLGRMDAVFAHTAAAVAFEAGGDLGAANVVWTDLLDREPCYDLASDAPPRMQEALRAAPRPPARCTARSLVGTAGSALLLPGFGRPNEPGRLFARSLVAASIVATSAAAFTRNEDAKAAYARYRSWNYTTGADIAPNPAVGHYNAAEDARMASLALYRISAAIYVGQAVWAVWAERRHRARIVAVSGYGGDARRVSILPVGRAGAPGLTVSLSW